MVLLRGDAVFFNDIRGYFGIGHQVSCRTWCVESRGETESSSGRLASVPVIGHGKIVSQKMDASPPLNITHILSPPCLELAKMHGLTQNTSVLPLLGQTPKLSLMTRSLHSLVLLRISLLSLVTGLPSAGAIEPPLALPMLVQLQGQRMLQLNPSAAQPL